MFRLMGQAAASACAVMLLTAGLAHGQTREELEKAKADLRKLEAALEAQKAMIKQAEDRLRRELEPDKRRPGGDGGPGFPGGRGGLDERTRQEIIALIRKVLEEERRKLDRERDSGLDREWPRLKPPGMPPAGLPPLRDPGSKAPPAKHKPDKPKQDVGKPGGDRPADLERRLERVEQQLQELMRQLRHR
jgi:hypothetical protein